MARIPFTLETWLKDKSQKVETRDGRIVHNIWPVKEPPIVNGKNAEVCALIDGEEDALVFFTGGKYLPVNAESPFDLFIVTPEEEMTEFEKAVGLVFTDAQLIPRDKDGIANIHDINDFIKKKAAELLILAKKECKNQIESDYRGIIDSAYKEGRDDALKDLPRWRKWENGCAGNVDGHPIALVSGAGGIRFVSVLGTIGEKYIMLDDLEKLPGFDNN